MDVLKGLQEKSTCCLTDEVMCATVHTVLNQVFSVMILNF